MPPPTPPMRATEIRNAYFNQIFKHDDLILYVFKCLWFLKKQYSWIVCLNKLIRNMLYALTFIKDSSY